MDRDERGNAFAFGVLAANDVARAFRGDHDHIHILRRNDRLIKNAEAVGEQECLAGLEVRLDVFFVGGGLLGVGDGDHNHLGAAHGLVGVEHFKAGLLRDFAALGFWIEADDDFATALFEVQRVGVALGAEAKNSKGLSLENFQVGVFVGVDFGRHGVVGWVCKKGGITWSGRGRPCRCG